MLRVNEEKVKLAPKGVTLPDLVKELSALEMRKKELDEKVEELKSVIHQIRVDKIPPLMEGLESDDFNVPGVGRVALSIEVYPSIKKDDIAAFYEWLRFNKNGAIIQEYIHPKTLQGFVKEQLSAGQAFPDYVTIAKIPTATLKKARKK
jgi:hypothetical protein